MAHDIFNTNFWKHRIETAKEKHYSVYVTNQKDWSYIDAEHKRILAKHVEGSVLDAGCGYGRMATFFMPEEYEGIDLTPEFIAIAQREHPAYRFSVADLRDLSRYRDQSFDWAFCVSIKRMVINNTSLEEWEQMERELKRVAKKLLILEYEDPTKYEIL